MIAQQQLWVGRTWWCSHDAEKIIHKVFHFASRLDSLFIPSRLENKPEIRRSSFPGFFTVVTLSAKRFWITGLLGWWCASSSYCFASLPCCLMGPIKTINGTEGHPVSSLWNILHRVWCGVWRGNSISGKFPFTEDKPYQTNYLRQEVWNYKNCSSSQRL